MSRVSDLENNSKPLAYVKAEAIGLGAGLGYCRSYFKSFVYSPLSHN